jgi:tRNA pseudouridine55 synthase
MNQLKSEKVISLYKPIGMTPLEAIRNFQDKNPDFQKQTLSYAGRLDPMAEGLLLVLIGEENSNRKRYELFDKTYKISVLFGIETDSYDILGLAKINYPRALTRQEHVLLYRYIKTLKGKYQQPYPPFSSKPVNGKPLYYWARRGMLDGLQIPTKEIKIKSIDLLKTKTISTRSLLRYILTNLALVKGDFRQEEIQKLWKDKLGEYPNERFSIITLRISCSSGTYMRNIAHEMGKRLQINALALSIKRTNVGSYTLEHTIKLSS